MIKKKITVEKSHLSLLIHNCSNFVPILSKFDQILSKTVYEYFEKKKLKCFFISYFKYKEMERHDVLR